MKPSFANPAARQCKRGQVSGAAEPGSSVVDTAVRELGEEVNVEVGEAVYCQVIVEAKIVFFIVWNFFS